MSIRAFTAIRLLTAVMLLAVSASMNAQTATTVGNVVYTLVGDDHYEATALAAGAEPTALTIASQVAGLPVTAIGSHAFDHCTSLSEITLPGSITAIGDYAFIGCNALTSVALPASLTTIGKFAFYSCQGLTDLSFCGTGLTLQVSAFADCKALRRITITGAAPTFENAVFNKVGTSDAPALVRIDIARLPEFLALTQPVANLLRFQEAYGIVAFQVVSDGLRYTYRPGLEEAPATYELAEIDAPTLPLQAATSYLITPPAVVGGISVTSIAGTGAFVNAAVNDRLYAIDLRSLPLTGIDVSRSSGVFAGVADHTLIYLPEGNHSDEDNVIVGSEALHHIKVRTGDGDIQLASADILSGQATWMLCQQWGAQLFGQCIGTDPSPQPMSDLTQQRVWQAAFLSAASAGIRQYRYANTGGTVALPSVTDMGYEAADIVNFYIDRDGSRPFTAATPVSDDLSVYALPQASGLTLSETSVAVSMSQPVEQRTFQLSAAVTPASACQSVTWATSDAGVATITPHGLLTVVGGGSATITCTSTDNPGVTATCQVAAIPLPQSISITPTEIRLSTAGDAAEAQLSATILPAEAIQEFTWESTNEQIVTVDASGRIKAVGVGKAYVHAYPKDYPSMYAICYVSVGSTVTSLALSASQLTLRQGETSHVSATITPSDALGGVTWSSSDETVATVSAGDIKAVAIGSCTITCTSNDNPSVKATVQVTIVPAIPLPQSISITPTEIRLSTAGEGAEVQLSATILPAEATQEFTWESTNEKIVTVDASGRIKAVGVGKAHIYVYPKSYPSMCAICYVSVGSTVTGLTLSASQLTLREGETSHVSATITPSDALGGVSWSSSDETVATVSAGDIKAIAGGNCTITARATDNPSVTATVKVTVLGTGATKNEGGIDYEISSMATDEGGSNTAKLTGASASLLGSGRTITIPTTVTIGGTTFQVTAIADDALGTPSNNTLIYIPYGIAYNGAADNVIQQQADGQKLCRRLVITDGCDFNTQHAFTAEVLVYHRTLIARSKPYTICLPYAMTSEQAGLTFYQFDHLEGDCMIMVSVPQSEPYVPYLVFAGRDMDDLGGRNVKIQQYSRNTAIYSGGYGMVGAMRGANNSESAGQSACILSDDGQYWLPCVADASLAIQPLRSWVWHQGPSILGNMSFISHVPPTSDTPSGISDIPTDGTNAAPYYDLQGRCVGTTLDGQPRGIYLREGKKYVKR